MSEHFIWIEKAEGRTTRGAWFFLPLQAEQTATEESCFYGQRKKERIEAETEVQVDHQNQKYEAQIPLEKRVSDEEIKSDYSLSKSKA